MAIFSLRKLTSCLLFMAVTFSPLMMISPDVGSTRRRRQRMSVDFPLPERPMMMNVSPCLISRETFFMATTASSPLSSSSTSSSFSTSEEETLIPFFLV